MNTQGPFILLTRGSALALTQTNMVLDRCQAAFPDLTFQIKTVKTTGDRLQTSKADSLNLPKGLFTKELEVELLAGRGHMAVHSLKDLPTELPEGLVLGAVLERADPRDVLICKRTSLAERPSGPNGFTLADLKPEAVLGTTSLRRIAQLREKRPDFKTIPLRGNVPTRLRKLAEQPDLDATTLAAAGLTRLGYRIQPDGTLEGNDAPPDLIALPLDVLDVLPCPGQGAIGLEVRADDARAQAICARLNHAETLHAVKAERAFLRAMGGGCRLPMAAYGQVEGGTIMLKVAWFTEKNVWRSEGRKPFTDAEPLGEALAAELKAKEAGAAS